MSWQKARCQPQYLARVQLLTLHLAGPVLMTVQWKKRDLDRCIAKYFSFLLSVPSYKCFIPISLFCHRRYINVLIKNANITIQSSFNNLKEQIYRFLRLKISGVIPPLSLYAFMACIGKSLHLLCMFGFTCWWLWVVFPFTVLCVVSKLHFSSCSILYVY